MHLAHKTSYAPDMFLELSAAMKTLLGTVATGFMWLLSVRDEWGKQDSRTGLSVVWSEFIWHEISACGSPSL